MHCPWLVLHTPWTPQGPVGWFWWSSCETFATFRSIYSPPPSFLVDSPCLIQCLAVSLSVYFKLLLGDASERKTLAGSWLQSYQSLVNSDRGWPSSMWCVLGLGPAFFEHFLNLCSICSVFVSADLVGRISYGPRFLWVGWWSPLSTRTLG